MEARHLNFDRTLPFNTAAQVAYSDAFS